MITRRRYVHPKTGYVFVRVKGHPRSDAKGYVFEHIVVAEKSLGRYLVEPNCVHHVDHDRGHNEGRNLVICEDAGYHLLLHARERIVKAGGDPNTDWLCSQCGQLSTGKGRGDGKVCTACYPTYLEESKNYKVEWRRRTGRAARKYRANLTEDEELALLAAFDAGTPRAEIAAQFQITESTINWVRKRNGRIVEKAPLLDRCHKGHKIETLPSGRRVCRQCRAESQRKYLAGKNA